ncbi:MAG: hypothetical protein PHY95_03290 [Candidatus ainarchaeum sp.]|nr:hypothetical protein [Candidatus ainarchaeum sp.]
MRFKALFLAFALVLAFGCVSSPEGAGNAVSSQPPASAPAPAAQPPSGPEVSEPASGGVNISVENASASDAGTAEPQMNDTNETAAEEGPSAPQPPTSRLLEWAEEGKVLTDGISCTTIMRGGSYWMYYTGMGGINLAQSSDGIHFTKKDAVLEGQPGMPVSNQAIIELPDGTYRMIYEVHTGDERRGETETRKLYSAVSSDGIRWTEEPGVRFYDYGEGNSIFTSVPDVLWFNDTLRMYYTVGLTSRIAVSTDNGLTWRKEKNIEVEGVSVLLDPDILRLEDGTYKLFFTSFPSGGFGEGEQVIMSASSLDGLNFVPDEGVRLEPSGSEMLVDPDVVAIPGGYRMYYAKLGMDSSDIYSAVSSE